MFWYSSCSGCCVVVVGVVVVGVVIIVLIITVIVVVVEDIVVVIVVVVVDLLDYYFKPYIATPSTNTYTHHTPPSNPICRLNEERGGDNTEYLKKSLVQRMEMVVIPEELAMLVDQYTFAIHLLR